VTVEPNQAKRCHLDSGQYNSTSLIIREPSNIDFIYSSWDDELPVQTGAALPTHSIEQGESTKGITISLHII
jgi:hypothetical protein